MLEIKMAKAKQEMTKNENLPAYIRQGGVARGSEEVSHSDIQLPRVDILQDLSPQVKKTNEKYIPGAEVGMLFNTLTKDLYPEGVDVVPVYFYKQWLVWKDQDSGGGLQGVFDTEAEGKLKEMEDPKNFECVETPTNVVLLLDQDGDFIMEATIPLAKSKMKISRQFNSMIRLTGGDRFSRVYHFRSTPDKNQAGKEYLNYKVATAGFPSEVVYRIAEKLYENLASGKVKVKADYSDADSAQSDSAAEY
jgi:hypothetical protein